jgi:hypothetical protein
MKKLWRKWMCKHKWSSHAKKNYSRKISDHWGTRSSQYTREILICEHCGKIKELEY